MASDATKSIVGEHLIPVLVRLISLHAHDSATALTAAKLLRSITVSSALSLALLCPSCSSDAP